MKKRFYIVFVSRDQDGSLSKVPVPLRYAYLFIAAAVIGMFTITGMAGQYSHMLLKMATVNDLRRQQQSLRTNYAHMEKVAHEKDVQAASLGALASEVSALYGLTQSKLSFTHTTAVKQAATAPLTAGTANSFSDDSYYKSLDAFYTLRTTAVSGGAAHALAGGIASSSNALGSSLDASLTLGDAPTLWPVLGPITSSFGQREDPIFGNGEGEFHKGIDISSQYGLPVRASADGTVAEAGTQNGYGKEVILDHGHGVTTMYAHMSGFNVMPGETVVRGQVIGYVGRTGRSTGAHLHYEVRIHNTPVNPHKYLRTTLAELGSTGS